MRPSPFRSLDNTERVLLSTPIMWLADGLWRLTGHRNRLTCPRCHAVGTFKPHGTRFDREDKRKVHRWLCKWCGYYIGPEGSCTAIVDEDTHVWCLPGVNGDGWTPRDSYAVSPIGRIAWPWRG